jgi:site-specific DNA-methyltransferase (adenine-specific)
MSEGTISQVLAGEATWALVHGDCREVLPTLPDKSINHTISDPPYSKDLYARTRTNKGSGVRKNGSAYSRNEGIDHTSAIRLASLAIGSIDDILDDVAAHMMRVTARWTIAFHDCETGDRWRLAFGAAYVRTGAWVKTDPMPQITGDRPGAGFEPCTIAHPRGRKRWNGGGRCAVWTHGTSKGHARPDHPCPKPVELMLDQVADFTDPGEIVLDPFAGSGTTGVACLRLGRRFIGIERDAKYAAVARERLLAEERGLSLREARAGQSSIFDVLGAP